MPGGNRLYPFLWRPSSAGIPLFSDNTIASNHDSKLAFDAPTTRPCLPGRIRGFSESLVPRHQDFGFGDLPATVVAVKNTSTKIIYDEHNHERYSPWDPTKRAFAYFVLTGGRFVYASLLRVFILKFVLSMSASKDVLALALLEVDLSSIEPGTTVTVKWRGKPVL